MRICAKVLIALSFPLVSLAGLDWLESNPVANSDLNGFAHVEKKISDVVFGDDAIRFSIEFSSNPAKAPGLLGPHWSISLFSSFAAKHGDAIYEWGAPNGSSYFFFKKNGQKTAKGEMYLQNDGEWILLDTGKDVRIEDGKNKSIFFLYRNGRLTQFRSTPSTGVFTIVYRGKEMPERIYNESTRKDVVKLSYGSDGLLKSLSSQEQTYQFDYVGSKLEGLGGLKLLGKITYPDSTGESFEYSPAKSRTRVVVDKNFGERWIPTVSAVRMTQRSSAGAESWVEWCEKTGIIMEDSGGEYRIGNPKYDFNFSAKAKENFEKQNRPARPEFVSINYLRNDKKGPERYFYDFDNAIRITEDADSGEIRKESLIATRGISYLEPRKIENLSGGSIKNPQWNLLKHFTYDDKGRLIRELDALGNVKLWEYFEKGNDIRSIIENGEVIFSKSFDKNLTKIFSKNADSLTWINEYPDGSRIMVEETEEDRKYYLFKDKELQKLKIERIKEE